MIQPLSASDTSIQHKHEDPHASMPWDEHAWKALLQDAPQTTAALLDYLDLSDLLHESITNPQFPVRAPLPYLDLITPGDPSDPLLLQILPQLAELQSVPGYVRDPLQETTAPSVQGGAQGGVQAGVRGNTPGIIQKYAHRALLVTTGSCAIHCRYCFRRHFPYAEHQQSMAGWRNTLDEIVAQPDITELIFSGGDPLMLSDQALQQLLQQSSAIPHVRRIRLHTRVPVVLPQRITDRLLQILGNLSLPIVIVVHSNHPREISNEVGIALQALAARGITMLNQSVILRGVNDEPAILGALSERLFEQRVLPYYLHAFDPVAGAHHFDVPDQEALRIHAMLMEQLPGYLVPKLVRETPGAAAKTPL